MSMEFDADTVSAPRLICMKRCEGGYGFNLHGEKHRSGQTISAVDDNSEAQKAGLRVGDKVIEVNGANVEGETHNDVVKRIKGNPEEVTMLVIDHITEAYLKHTKRPITADMANLATVYQPEEDPKESTEPAAAEDEKSVSEVQESNSGESEPSPLKPVNGEAEVAHGPETTNDETREEEKPSEEAEVANDATTPEEVKQLNEVLDKEDSSSPPEPTPEFQPTTVEQTNGTAAPAAPVPESAPMIQPSQRSTSKPLRSTIKQQKAESWDDKFKKFQQL